jgi:hypothetical protein
MKKPDAKRKPKAPKAKLPSAFEGVRADKNPKYLRRITAGAHKYKPKWKRLLAASRKEWLSPDQDLSISKAADTQKPLHPDEHAAAVKWECFRHLYFSGHLSEFWRAMIEEDQLEVRDQFRGKRLFALLVSNDPNGFAEPWARWADDPCFPALAWMQARERPSFKRALRYAPQPSEHVKLRKDELSTWELLRCWVKAQIENQSDHFQRNEAEALSDILQRAKNPLEIPCHEVPKQPHSKTSTHVVLKIDWNSTKEELTEAFLKEIEPLWEKRNPDGKMGRRDSELGFFKGLVLRRRLDRGVSDFEACTGFYTALRDRKDCMPSAAKTALALADSRVAQTKAALEEIEARLRQS